MRGHRIRRTNKAPTKKSAREPATEQAWRALMQKVIRRAERLKDKRLPALKRAISDGKTVALLKRMRIICDNDILRVFPDQ